MADDKHPTDAEAKKNREEIERMDATQTGARGNTHSEADDPVPDHDAPPPLPH